MPRKIHTNANKIKTLAKKIGEIYKKAAVDPNHVIDRAEIVDAIDKAMLSKNKSGKFPNATLKTLMFDVVVDEDLDENTRLIWLTLPTPDLKDSGSGYEDWADYMEGSLNYNKTTKKFNDDDELIKLTEAILFGCGR